MKVYQTPQIRNIALAGHTGSGKTSLSEAFLWTLKQSQRHGKTDEGNTISDYDPEEIRRQMSIQSSVIPVEHEDHKINFIDLPGSRDFIGDIKRGLRASDGVLLTLDVQGGFETGAEFAYNTAREFNRAQMIFVNKLEKENTNFEQTLENIRAALDVRLFPVTIPAGAGPDFQGVIDLMRMKLVKEEDQKVSYEAIPAQFEDAAQAAHAELVEAAAEGDDELTMKFLEEEALSHEEIIKGLHKSVAEGRFIPVFCGSAIALKGIRPLLDFIVNCMPDPTEPDGYAYTVDGGEEQILKVSPEGPVRLYVFKTVADPFAGRLSYFKVLTGKLTSDTTLENVNQGKTEKLSHIMWSMGKKSEDIPELNAGDIGTVAKLDATHTTDTLIQPGSESIKITPIRIPPPTTFRAVVAKSRSDEDKIGVGFRRLTEQDPTLNLYRDPELRQTILSGMGEMQLEVAVNHLKESAKVDVDLEIPRVPYRETITKAAEGQGKYKKQTGGHGQYGDCWIRFEPLPEGSGFEFEWAIVGGVIPTGFKPAVEKGLNESKSRGVLAGSETVDFKAVCYDGSHHSVDSSEMSFKMAASMAFKSVIPKCNPVILEPIYKVTITVPEDYMGDVMGDLNSRRGRILGMNAVGHNQIIEAQVPLSEMYTYGRQLNSISQGRGIFEMVFDHYERVPGDVQNKIIEEHQRAKEEEEAG